MVISKRKLFSYIEVSILLISYAVGLQAQSATSKSDIALAIIDNQRITVASNGDILSIAEGGYSLSTNNNDTVIINYSNISADTNRDISVWEGNNYPSAFYFPIDRHLLLRNYHNNTIMLTALDELIESKQVIEALDTIEITGACSPVGGEEYNLKLALSRCMALRSYLRQMHSQLAKSVPIKFNIIGIDRFGYNMLKKQNPPFTEKQIWDRLQYAAIRLKMKDGSYIIPGADKQRTSFNLDTLKPSVFRETRHNMRDTVFLKCDTIYITTTQYMHTGEFAKTPKPLHLAFKTNLLYDAAFLPNLTVEWYMGKQWSLAIEGNWSWWKFNHPIQNWWYHRIQAGGIELRRWFNSPYPLRGHALGIYSMIGNYDVRFFTKNEYTKGDLSYLSWSAGLSYAYSFSIARKLNLELGLAIGYLGGRYYKYDYCMAHAHWAKQGMYNRNYIGPTRVGVSLVWLLGAGNDEKSRNNYMTLEKHKQFMLLEK